MVDETTLLRRADDVTYQSFGPGEDTVILCLRTGQLHTCNETTRALLDILDRPCTFGESLDRLYGQYTVSREKLHADLIRLTERLIQEGILVAER